MREVVIVSAARTPVGSYQGSLSSLKATELGAIAIKEAVKRANIKPEDVSEVIMGCVLPAGIGQAPARQAAMSAGLPDSVPCLTINKVCGSGLKSVMLAEQAIKCGDAEIVVAGGFESMSNVPYYLDKARTGYRMGNGTLIDGMIKDGLWDVYNDFHMGSAAEMCATEMKITREEQDAFAETSYKRALDAIEKGHFKDEIVPVEVKGRKENVIVSEDEDPKKVNFEKGKTLKGAFEKDGTVTAFNSSNLNDGAAAMVLMSADKAKELGLKPLAKILSWASAGVEPAIMGTGPVPSSRKALAKIGMTIDDMDVIELNEAFAAQAVYCCRELKVDMDKTNIYGGAIALGHPIGCSGARIMVTLLNGLQARDGEFGLASLCIGGGQGTACVIQRLK